MGIRGIRGIRTKILVIVGCAFVLFMATLILVSRVVVLEGFNDLETEYVNINAQRTLSELNSTLAKVASVAGDWAPWDETYSFIQDQNEDYIQDNLSAETIVNLDINFMLFVNNDEKLIYETAVNLATGESASLPEGLRDKIRSLEILNRHDSIESNTAGVVVAGRHSALVVSQPILKSDFSGPIQGTLILGKYVDEGEIQQMAQTTLLTIGAFTYEDELMPPDYQIAKNTHTLEPQVNILKEEGNTISGYVLKMDIEGNPGIIFKVTMPRKVYLQGLHTVNYFLISLVIVGLIFFVLLYLVLDIAILAPLARLSNAVASTKFSDNGPETIALARDDELGRLADEINKMLIHIHRKTVALNTANYELKKDVAERQKTEKALRNSEEKFRFISEQSLLAIMIIQDGFIKYANQAFSDIVEQPVQEMLSWGSYEYAKYIHQQDKDFVMEQSLKKQEGEASVVTNYNFRIVSKTGVVKWVDLYSRAILFEEKTAVLVTILDISEKMKFENEKTNLQVQLLRAEKMEAIGTLAGGVAHDLNNILSGIVSYPDLILLQLPGDSPFKKLILTIKESGQKAAAIVEDLLTMARRGVAIEETINLNTVVEGYLQSPEYNKLKSFHPEVTVRLNLEKRLLNNMGSPVHLSKSIMNLVSNAAEAVSEDGKISITSENRYIDKPIKGYEDVEEGDYVVLTVSDTGVGISPEEKSQIFEPFYTKKKMGRSGTGLGMAVVWGTVKDHSGYIDIESSIGEGTAISLYIPATRRPLAEDMGSLPIETYQGMGESILVVDDVQIQREVAGTILVQLGYVVTSVSSGEEALEFLREHTVDLLILDMIMPTGMDGLETYKKILKIRGFQKAVITSGYVESDKVKKTQKLGAGEYIKKPYTLEKIGLAVKKELHVGKTSSSIH
jgi:PAS domain S-box-containing protein